MTKQWWRSRTLWFNATALVVGVAGAALNVIRGQTWIVALTVVVALGNGVLRLLTDTGIARPGSGA